MEGNKPQEHQCCARLIVVHCFVSHTPRKTICSMDPSERVEGLVNHQCQMLESVL